MGRETIINNLVANYGKYGVTRTELEPQRAAVYYFVTIHGLGPLIVTIRGDIESLLRKTAPHS